MHNIGVQIYLFFSKQENKTPYFYVLLLLVRLSTNPFVQFLIERMCGHRGSRSKYDELHAGTGDGYIHATQVAQETDLLAVVVAYERYDDYVALLSLETVDGVHADGAAVRAEEFALPYHFMQQLHLRTIGRYDTHVDMLVEDALLANLLEVLL